MTALFGTDGIRARAGEGPLAPASLEKIGAILGRMFAPGPVLIGRDTRASGPGIEARLTAGLRSRVLSLGVAPTPVVSMMTPGLHATLGIAISASHNPAEDNGIKLFGPDGRKIPDLAEREIERLYDGDVAWPDGAPAHENFDHQIKLYLDVLRARFPLKLKGMKIVVDTANGATVRTAPALLESLGANVVAIGNAPDGGNINAGCGAVHPEAMQAKVRETGAAIGIAFDGDGDRAMFADERGERRDGDMVLFLAAPAYGARVVVGTSMTNYGLEKALAERGVALVRAPVGDRFVAEQMEVTGAPIGGEPSGHIIFPNHAPTGDGLLTALVVLKILRESKKKLSELCAGLAMFPQRIQNVPVRAKPPIESLPAVMDAVARASRDLNGRGRVVVRYSGTESLLRIMVEAGHASDVDRWIDGIEAAVRKDLV